MLMIKMTGRNFSHLPESTDTVVFLVVLVCLLIFVPVKICRYPGWPTECLERIFLNLWFRRNCE
jgi:hypothetical protein